MSDELKTTLAEKIRLLSTSILHSNFEASFELSNNDIEGVHFDLGYNMAFNMDAEQVKTEIGIDITSKNKDQETEEAKGKFIYAFVYHIEGLKEFTRINDDNGITVDGTLSATLASITYSTTRGMLLSHLNGTCLSQSILPVIDPNQLLENMNNKKD